MAANDDQYCRLDEVRAAVVRAVAGHASIAVVFATAEAAALFAKTCYLRFERGPARWYDDAAHAVREGDTTVYFQIRDAFAALPQPVTAYLCDAETCAQVPLPLVEAGRPPAAVIALRPARG